MIRWLSRLVVLANLAAVPASCGKGDLEPPTGTEGGSCYGNGTCDSPLACDASEVCVQPVTNLCEGISCADHGSCVLENGNAICQCDDGYHAEALTCVADSSQGRWKASDLFADMQQPSEMTYPSELRNNREAAIMTGGVPRGDATPWWWQPDDQDLKSAAYWNVVLPWFVIYPATKHTATNVRVKVSGIWTYLLKASTRQWVAVAVQADIAWADRYTLGDPLTTWLGPADMRTEPDGHVSMKLAPSGEAIHGGLAKYAIDGADTAACFVVIETELIVDDPSVEDDRADAYLGFQTGSDWYPDMTTNEFPPDGYNPGIGESRWTKVTNSLRPHFMATIDPPGNLDNPHSPFQQAGGVVAIPVSEFLANPPPGVSSSE